MHDTGMHYQQLMSMHMVVSGLLRVQACRKQHARSVTACMVFASLSIIIIIPSLIEGVWEVQVEAKSAAWGWIFHLGEV